MEDYIKISSHEGKREFIYKTNNETLHLLIEISVKEKKYVLPFDISKTPEKIKKDKIMEEKQVQVSGQEGQNTEETKINNEEIESVNGPSTSSVPINFGGSHYSGSNPNKITPVEEEEEEQRADTGSSDETDGPSIANIVDPLPLPENNIPLTPDPKATPATMSEIVNDPAKSNGMTLKKAFMLATAFGKRSGEIIGSHDDPTVELSARKKSKSVFWPILISFGVVASMVTTAVIVYFRCVKGYKVQDVEV